MSLTLPAPAKINLVLRVLRKRDDGFHEIESLMTQLPGLADEIRLSQARQFSFTCSKPDLCEDEDNLVVRAVRAFERASGIICKCALHLEKRIPHGAGLGGGSSDAAATLLALNEWHDSPLKDSEIHHLASGLGSDVPFFLLEGPAEVLGRGEIIRPAPAHPPLHLLLLKPGFGVSTPDAYKRWSNSRWLPGLDRSMAREVKGVRLVNDLERPVLSKHLFLAELVEWLENQPEVAAAQLCGSGSTIFAILSEIGAGKALTNRARAELDPKLWSWMGSTLA